MRGAGVAALLAAHLGLLVTFDLAGHPWPALACLAAALAGLAAFGLPRASGTVAAARHGWRAKHILLVAAALRFLLLPLPPTLSDDALRYLWDGKVAAAGFDAYRLAPEAPELAPLLDDSRPAPPHPDQPTVYPPLALLGFSISALLPMPLLALKALFAGCDLGTCALLLGAARRIGFDEERVVWYAWNPLVTLEVAGMGHVEGLGVAMATAAVTALAVPPRRALRAALAAAAGILAKLAPLAALPMWARQSGRPGRFLIAAVALAGLGLVPMLAGGLPPALIAYGASWEFNGPLYEPLWRLLEAAGVPGAVKGGLDWLKLVTGEHEAWNRVYPYVYGGMIARLLLAAGAAVAIIASVRRPDPVSGSGFLFGALLLASPTVYPWYLLWVLPWAALCLQPAWLVLSATMTLAYLPRLFGLELVPWVFVAIWLPFLAVLLWRPKWSFV